LEEDLRGLGGMGVGVVAVVAPGVDAGASLALVSTATFVAAAAVAAGILAEPVAVDWPWRCLTNDVAGDASMRPLGSMAESALGGELSLAPSLYAEGEPATRDPSGPS
jgi:hypothetical protein